MCLGSCIDVYTVLQINKQGLTLYVCLTGLIGITLLLLVLDYMLVVPCYCPSSLCYSNYIGSVMMIVTSIPHYCAMGLSLTVFSLDSYSRPYGRNSIISGIIIFLSFLFVFQLIIHDAHHHCLCSSVFYLSLV